MYTPASLLPQQGITWRAESENEIVASWDVPPERPELHLHIDGRGALRSYHALRWGNVGQKEFRYIPCGCEVAAERRFGDFVVPSSVTGAWWFGPRATRRSSGHRSAGWRPSDEPGGRSGFISRLWKRWAGASSTPRSPFPSTRRSRRASQSVRGALLPASKATCRLTPRPCRQKANVAIEAADVTLISGELRGVVTSLDLSLATMRNIRENLVFAFGYDALGIPIAAGVLCPFFDLQLSPMIAAAAMAASSLSVSRTRTGCGAGSPPPPSR